MTKINKELLDKFNQNPYSLNRDEVKTIQSWLGFVKDGKNHNKLDGYIGPDTIKAFQRKIGTKDDGIWGKNSRAAYEEFINTDHFLDQTSKKLMSLFVSNSTKSNAKVSSKKEPDKTEHPISVGNYINTALDYLSGQWLRRKATDALNEKAINLKNETARQIASTFGIINSGLYDIAQARINTEILKKFPNYLPDPGKEKLTPGVPAWTIDKTNRIARYYDENNILTYISPASTGLISGKKSIEGDNKTPEGIYSLFNPQLREYYPYGGYYYATSHKNDDSKQFSGVGLHGTGTPYLNGTNLSHGCIRIDNKVIEDFYNSAPKKGQGAQIIIYE